MEKPKSRRTRRPTKSRTTFDIAVDEYMRRLCHKAVATVCYEEGFRRTRGQALETLTDVFTSYCWALAETTRENSELVGRSEANVLDVAKSLKTYDVSARGLKRYADAFSAPRASTLNGDDEEDLPQIMLPIGGVPRPVRYPVYCLHSTNGNKGQSGTNTNEMGEDGAIPLHFPPIPAGHTRGHRPIISCPSGSNNIDSRSPLLRASTVCQNELKDQPSQSRLASEKEQSVSRTDSNMEANLLPLTNITVADDLILLALLGCIEKSPRERIEVPIQYEETVKEKDETSENEVNGNLCKIIGRGETKRKRELNVCDSYEDSLSDGENGSPSPSVRTRQAYKHAQTLKVAQVSLKKDKKARLRGPKRHANKRIKGSGTEPPLQIRKCKRRRRFSDTTSHSGTDWCSEGEYKRDHKGVKETTSSEDTDADVQGGNGDKEGNRSHSKRAIESEHSKIIHSELTPPVVGSTVKLPPQRNSEEIRGMEDKIEEQARMKEGENVEERDRRYRGQDSEVGRQPCFSSVNITTTDIPPSVVQPVIGSIDQLKLQNILIRKVREGGDQPKRMKMEINQEPMKVSQALINIKQDKAGDTSHIEAIKDKKDIKDKEFGISERIKQRRRQRR